MNDVTTSGLGTTPFSDGQFQQSFNWMRSDNDFPTMDADIDESDIELEETAMDRAYMQNRELSWLTFNERVLDQGADESVPLLERLNFISIFWSNLQEFFMVRVGSLTDLSFIKPPVIDSRTGMTPDEQIAAIHERCHELYPIQESYYEHVRGSLAKHGVRHLRPDDLSDEQKNYLGGFVQHNIFPFLSPQIINSRHPFPHLENGKLYILVRLNDDDEEEKKKKKKDKKGSKKEKVKVKEKGGASGVVLGLIPLPHQCERVIKLPGRGFQFILLEHAIEMFVPQVFSMYSIKHTNVICVTRNADLDANQGGDEQDEDYREHMKRLLKQRARLAPVRLECERPLSPVMEKHMLKKLGLKRYQVYDTIVPLDLSFTWGLGDKLSEGKRAKLTNTPFTPAWPTSFDRNRPMLDQVGERDILLSYPYESMDPFVQLLREAANDPSVISIKITLYRLASQSHLAEALIAAAENGKEVTALFELRARFDESNNIEWSQRFEQAGCNVIYGFRNYKVHSKICCITRNTENGVQHITQLGTGNYNEKTAKLYTDLSFITTDETFGRDAREFFRNMLLENVSDNYEMLCVAPLQIKPMILNNLNHQIALARQGLPCGAFLKANSITDIDVIEKIAEASREGVQVTLFIRGICCIVPEIKGETENVRVVSIVGRLLEHSRIYCFGTPDNCVMYLSSADLMTRNLNKRVEIAWPILDQSIRGRILDYIDICLHDTAKLRELRPNKTYTPLGAFCDLDEDGNALTPFDAQNALIERSALAAERVARANASHEPVTLSPEEILEPDPFAIDPDIQPAVAFERERGLFADDEPLAAETPIQNVVLDLPVIEPEVNIFDTADTPEVTAEPAIAPEPAVEQTFDPSFNPFVTQEPSLQEPAPEAAPEIVEPALEEAPEIVEAQPEATSVSVESQPEPALPEEPVVEEPVAEAPAEPEAVVETKPKHLAGLDAVLGNAVVSDLDLPDLVIPEPSVPGLDTLGAPAPANAVQPESESPVVPPLIDLQSAAPSYATPQLISDKFGSGVPQFGSSLINDLKTGASEPVFEDASAYVQPEPFYNSVQEPIVLEQIAAGMPVSIPPEEIVDLKAQLEMFSSSLDEQPDAGIEKADSKPATEQPDAGIEKSDSKPASDVPAAVEESALPAETEEPADEAPVLVENASVNEQADESQESPTDEPVDQPTATVDQPAESNSALSGLANVPLTEMLVEDIVIPEVVGNGADDLTNQLLNAAVIETELPPVVKMETLPFDFNSLTQPQAEITTTEAPEEPKSDDTPLDVNEAPLDVNPVEETVAATPEPEPAPADAIPEVEVGGLVDTATSNAVEPESHEQDASTTLDSSLNQEQGTVDEPVTLNVEAPVPEVSEDAPAVVENEPVAPAPDEPTATSSEAPAEAPDAPTAAEAAQATAEAAEATPVVAQDPKEKPDFFDAGHREIEMPPEKKGGFFSRLFS